MDKNEIELGEEDFDDEEHEDSDEMPGEGTKYFYNNRNPALDYENKIFSILSSVRVSQRHFHGQRRYPG